MLDDAISNDQTFAWFREVFEYVQEEANIPLEIIDNNEHEDGGINFYIRHTGPLGGRGNNKKVKVDISRSENLIFKTINQEVIISYSDQEPHKLLCYPLEEVLVEKLRSVMQRMQPRDFYDIWYLLEINGMDVNSYAGEFKAKCDNKKINSAEFHKKINQRLA